MRIEMEDLQRHVMLEINQGNNQAMVVEKVISFPMSILYKLYNLIDHYRLLNLVMTGCL
jgi:hypothetical protein